MLMHDTWVLRVCLCLGGKVIVDSEPRMNYRQHQNNTVGLKHGFFSTIKQVQLYMFNTSNSSTNRCYYLFNWIYVITFRFIRIFIGNYEILHT